MCQEEHLTDNDKIIMLSTTMK